MTKVLETVKTKAKGYRTFGINVGLILGAWIVVALKGSVFEPVGIILPANQEAALLVTVVSLINIGLRKITNTPMFKNLEKEMEK